jgi:hypothetical protein
MKAFKIDQRLTVAHRPEADGQSERAIRSTIETMRTVLNDMQQDWAKHIALVEFALNDSISANGQTPFMVVYGVNPARPPNNHNPRRAPTGRLGKRRLQPTLRSTSRS